MDPLAQIVALLQPCAPFSKRVSAGGRWSVRSSKTGEPYYCAVLEGSCRLTDDEGKAKTIVEGDFLLAPSGHSFELSSLTPPKGDEANRAPTILPDGEFRHGPAACKPDVQLLVGHCVFRSPDADLLASLLPRLIHVRNEERLATLVKLVSGEARAQRPARDVIVERLLEVLFIEAVRSSEGLAASPGLLRGLADDRLALALRRMHEDPTGPWSIAQLASAASLSRSAFFDRFRAAMGVAPMEYLLAWRMALAKKALREKKVSIAKVAEQVGYSSASTFTVAFTRYVGVPPARYARESTADNVRSAHEENPSAKIASV